MSSLYKGLGDCLEQTYKWLIWNMEKENRATIQRKKYVFFSGNLEKVYARAEVKHAIYFEEPYFVTQFQCHDTIIIIAWKFLYPAVSALNAIFCLGLPVMFMKEGTIGIGEFTVFHTILNLPIKWHIISLNELLSQKKVVLVDQYGK